MIEIIIFHLNQVRDGSARDNNTQNGVEERIDDVMITKKARYWAKLFKEVKSIKIPWRKLDTQSNLIKVLLVPLPTNCRLNKQLDFMFFQIG